MYQKWKDLMKITAKAEKQSVSMHRKLVAYWIIMALSVFGVLLVILSAAGVFSNAEKLLHRTLSVQQENTVEEIHEQIDSLKIRGVQLSNQIGSTLDDVYYTESVSEISDRPKDLLNIQNDAYPMLLTALWGSPGSGAYFILDATTNTAAEGAETSRTGMYLRYVNLSVKNEINPDVVYFRGIPEIARKHKLELHNRWNLEFNVTGIPEYETILKSSFGRAADGIFWSGRMQLVGTWEDIMLMMVPVLDINGNVQGVCGLEVSEMYFRMSYPSVDSHFGNLITVMAPIRDGKLLMDQAMVGGLDGVYMEDTDVLQIKEGKYYNKYIGENETYLGLHRKMDVEMADGTSVAVVTLLSEASYSSIARAEQWTWVGISGAFLVIMLLLSYVLSKKFVKPILSSFSDLQGEGDITYSGISEVDALVDYINSKMKNQPVAEGSLPPDIAEMFTSFAERAKTLTATERKILKYYIDGYEVSQIPEVAFISINTVRKHNANIYQKMKVNSKDELMLYIELFRRCDRLEEIYDIPNARKQKEE
ncbi:MAG: LuxR C-terminal-related transcriptional regulator [Bacillota bacterium]|nr:LuxR C-terminal-related transcriptional regulator [Bacillota bacterium]